MSSNTESSSRTEVPREVPAPAVPDRRTRLVSSLLLGAVVVAVLVAGWARRWTSDDAFINFRVVANLLAGNGPVFNAGERVEVATSPLWLFVLTVADAVVPGDSVAWSSVVLGLALTATGVLLAALGASRLYATAQARVMVPVGMVVFVALPPTWDFTTSGLETGLSFSWLGLSFWGLARWARSAAPSAYRPLWLFVLLGLGPLVRPDFAVISGVLLLWLLVAGSGRWWQRLIGPVAAGLLPVGYQVFRMGYYGLLVPNTAVAKESSRPLWDRGLTYLTDTVGPHWLWLPVLLAALLFAVAAPQLRLRARGWSLVAVVVVAAVLHALYVVRVGGDFMHARLLMPSVFLLLCPVAALPVTRRLWVVSTALLAAVGVWAVASAVALRTDYEGGLNADGIADERGFYAHLAGVEHPVTLADHGGAGVSAYTAQVVQRQRAGVDEIVLQVTPVTPQTPISVLAPSSGGMVFSVGNAGFYGVAAGLDVLVIDGFGLTDPIASHIEPGPPGRPGHEKVFPSWWLLARYGAAGLAEQPTEGLPPPDMIATARETLACGDVAELLDATSGPLTWDRFWDNVSGAVDRTSLRIPVDVDQARDDFC